MSVEEKFYCMVGKIFKSDKELCAWLKSLPVSCSFFTEDEEVDGCFNHCLGVDIGGLHFDTIKKNPMYSEEVVIGWRVEEKEWISAYDSVYSLVESFNSCTGTHGADLILFMQYS